MTRQENNKNNNGNNILSHSKQGSTDGTLTLEDLIKVRQGKDEKGDE